VLRSSARDSFPPTDFHRQISTDGLLQKDFHRRIFTDGFPQAYFHGQISTDKLRQIVLAVDVLEHLYTLVLHFVLDYLLSVYALRTRYIKPHNLPLLPLHIGKRLIT
jgi:hypothetical protein